MNRHDIIEILLKVALNTINQPALSQEHDPSLSLLFYGEYINQSYTPEYMIIKLKFQLFA
jgi:hypothetical protein